MTKPLNLNDVKIGIKDLLPEKDYDRNKAGIVSQVVGKPITVEYQAGINCAYETKKGYTVIKAMPKAKGIDGNTAINHELAHILFNSFEKKVTRTLHKWVNEWFGDGSSIDGYKTHSPNRVKNELIFQTYHEALNIIEDQRIESLWGKLYLGNVKEFIRTRKRLGQDLKENDHPSNMLLAERFYRPDLVEGKYKHVGSMLHNVEGKDLKASLVVLKQIKPYLDEIIQELLDNMDKVKDKQEEFSTASVNKNDDSKELQDIIADRNIAEQQVRKTSPVKHNQHRANPSIKDQSVHSDTMFVDEDGKQDDSIFTDSELGEKELDVLKEAADSKIQQIKDQMGASQIPVGKVYVNFREVEKDKAPDKIKVNDRVVKEIKHLLRTFKEKRKDVISSDGDELDVSSYIDMKANGYGECMVNDVKEHGLSICVSIDASGSMTQHNLVVEQIMSTIWKSIEDTKTIDLKCIAWASDSLGNMHIRRYNEDTIGYLDKQVGGFTPTHFGIKIGSEELAKMKGEKKLLIVITDGYPNYYKNHTKIRGDVAGKETIKSFKLAMKQNPNILILGIGGYMSYMKKMFGNKFIQCSGMHEVEKFMMKKFKREVINVMRK